MNNQVLPALFSSKAFTIIIATICLIIVGVIIEMKYNKYNKK